MENTNKMSKEQRIEKSAQFQAARLQKATEKFEAAKNYEQKATGAISESLREAKSLRIVAMSVEGLATACVNRVKELSKTSIEKYLLRYVKKAIADDVRANIGEEKLPLFVDCSRGEYKVDMAIKYACAATRDEEVKKILKAMKKAK